MTWNYRVVRRKYPDGEVLYQMHEVYYDNDGNPDGVSACPVDVTSDAGVDGIKWVLTSMQEAAEKPVLDYDADFPDSAEDSE